MTNPIIFHIRYVHLDGLCPIFIRFQLNLTFSLDPTTINLKYILVIRKIGTLQLFSTLLLAATSLQLCKIWKLPPGLASTEKNILNSLHSETNWN